MGFRCLMKVLAPFFCDYFCSASVMCQLCCEFCFPNGGKVTPVVHQQTAYSRRRERICIPEFLTEVLNFELLDQFWGWALLQREGFSNCLRSLRS